MKHLLNIIISLILIYLTCIAECGFFSSSIDKLKKKAKEAYKKNKLGKGWQSLTNNKANRIPESKWILNNRCNVKFLGTWTKRIPRSQQSV